MVRNQTTMTGPNSRPTTPLPSLCSTKSTTMMVTVIGTTKVSMDGSIVSIPSTAESTEIAGVIMLSPKNSAAPKTPRPASRNLRRAGTPSPSLRICEISAMVPPSPSSSALMTSRTYLTVTMSVTAQKISETRP